LERAERVERVKLARLDARASSGGLKIGLSLIGGDASGARSALKSLDVAMRRAEIILAKVCHAQRHRPVA
jgi:hypothetical protein